MKVSVIVPVYKAEAYLHKCVDSLLAQTMTDFEVLLINDGSPDRSGAICDEYAVKDSRIRVFHKENGGVSSARNLGLDNARGEWIAFVDSDDWVEMDYLSQLTYDLGVDFVSGGMQVTNGTCYRAENMFYSKEEINKFLQKHYSSIFVVSPCNKLFKNEIIKQNDLRYDLKIYWAEDRIFVRYYLLYCSSIKTISSIAYNYLLGVQKVSYAEKYNLSLGEVDYIASNIRSIEKKLEQIFDVKFDNLEVRNCCLSMCRLKKFSKEDVNSYYELCKKYYLSLEGKEFYNDSFLSPVIKGISELKIYYRRKDYYIVKDYFYRLSDFYKSNSCSFQDVSIKNNIVLYLIKNKQWFIFDKLMKLFYN